MKKLFALATLAMMGSTLVAQELERKLDNWYPQTKEGINLFETPKDTVSNFDKVKVKIGGGFALQYQAIQHENRANELLNADGVNTNQLYDIGNNFNLATANLDLDVALYDGVNLHLRTFLSSRHHNEAYVKGGYLQIDKLDFIQKDFLKDVMQYATIKFGHNEINYGDAHFRRSDNANVMTNPFVGNLLMDAYATMIFAEVYYKRNGWLGMAAISNGRLNQTATGGTSPSIYGKLGYDKQLSDDLRVRLTGSFYNTAQTMRSDFYNGDRAGSRYYFVMENSKATSSGNFSSGQINPTMNEKLTAIMINPFVRYKGLEFFGVYENARGKNAGETDKRSFNQYAAEMLFRFGNHENFYFGGKYNQVKGEMPIGDKVDITRFNVGGGWFMTNNIMVKLEYVNQKYKGYNPDSIFHGGKFSGFVAEAAIAF